MGLSKNTTEARLTLHDVRIKEKEDAKKALEIAKKQNKPIKYLTK